MHLRPPFMAALAGLLAVFAAVSTASPAMAQTTTAEDAARFGGLAAIESISLSPDGSKIAFISPSTGRGNDLFVVGTAEGAGRPLRILRASGDPEQLDWCTFKTESRLICGIVGRHVVGDETIPFSRLIGVDAAGGNVIVIGTEYRNRSENFESSVYRSGSLIDLLPDDPENVLILDADLNLVRVNVTTNRVVETVIRRRGEGLFDYISDGRGNVRIMMRQQVVADASIDDVQRYFFRPVGGGEWQPLSVNNSTVDDGFRPAFIDAVNNRAVGFLKVDGFDTVAAMALDGTGTLTSLYARPGVEIDRVILSGPHRRVVGVSYLAEYRQRVFFDEVYGRMSGQLSRALGGRSVSIYDESTDGSHLLVRAGSDTDPGRYLLYIPAARQLRPLLAVMPQLEGRTLANVRAITFPAADGTQIPGYLTLPAGHDSAAGLPAIVMPHGGPSARDDGSYDFVAQFLASQGFAVLQPNYRGSSGYGDAWYLNNGIRSWRTAIGDVTDGGRWLVAQGVDPARLSIVGWSYGGYAALQSGVVAPDLFRSIVAIAPVTDWGAMRRESIGRFNGRLVRDFIGEGPHLREGSPALNAGAITVPVLMFHGTLDRNVDIEQARAMRRALQSAGRPVELVEYDGLAHSLETSDARADMLRRIAAFLPH